MLMRLWSGRVPRYRAEEFRRYLLDTGGRDIPATPGNCGYYIGERAVDAEIEFCVVSLWDSEDAIRDFAGADPTLVRYYPRDAEFLTEQPLYAMHFGVIANGSSDDPDASTDRRRA